MTETIWSSLIKINKLMDNIRIIPQKMNEKNVDVISDFTHAEYALLLRHSTCQFGLRFRLSSVVIA